MYTETSYEPRYSAGRVIGTVVGAGIATSLLHGLFRPRRRHLPPPPIGIHRPMRHGPWGRPGMGRPPMGPGRRPGPRW